jgi:hypothetical protein
MKRGKDRSKSKEVCGMKRGKDRSKSKARVRTGLRIRFEVKICVLGC